MGRTGFRIALMLALATAGAVGIPTPALPQSITPDITKMDYTPIGFYEPGDPIPATSAAGTLDPNPSGKWVAYDTNVFESITFPNRHPGDVSATEAPGNGSQPYGFCPQGDPAFVPWGKCDDHPDSGNHQLEYLDYFEQTMQEILGPFGVVIHRYEFNSPGAGEPGTYLSAGAGRAFNITATVPGADAPDESVLVSGHYDFTFSGPAAAWDSAEGHAQVIRIAKIMADYWTATGTRPSATVKFIPWDSEESGTFGSIDYVQNNIPPGEEAKVRGYFNMDPCAGAYPAFKNGNPLVRVPEILQLTDPESYDDPATEARVAAFNERAETIVDEVLDNLDDTIDTPLGPQPIFVSDAEAAAGENGGDSQRDEIVTALGGLAIFSSDYANFAAAGIPIFNLFPDYFGPHADGTPGHNDGIAILHTPNDNLTTINKLTSADPSGLTASEGWAKGMEMCSHMEGWYMLQPEMGGAETATGDVVAYYEALPNEALPNEEVTFDASGTYQYADAGARTLVPDSSLVYTWDFGDGQSATGKVVTHSFAEIGRHTTTLTVTGEGGSTDTMTVPVVVIGRDSPVLHPIDPADAADGDFGLTWDFDTEREGFDHFSVQESTDFTTLFYDDAQGGPEVNWTVEMPSDPVQPWQASDSATVKLRGNQSRSGDRSFWTGVSPPDFNPGPINVPSILMLNQQITVPPSGDTEINFWSLFQNEGDDQGRVEVALVDDAGNMGPWRAVKVIQAPPTAVGDPHEPLICDPSTPETFLEDFRFERASLIAFRGKTIMVRLNYFPGPNNRLLSQPCGWYVDDVRVESGSFTEIGTTAEHSFQVSGRVNGTYAYRITGVFTDEVQTAPSNAEVAEVTEGTEGNRPDLVVTNITASNKKAREGDKVTVTATVANQGNDDAGASQAEFLLDGATVLGLADTPAIPEGGSTQVSVNWDTRGVKGEHTIEATADKAGAVNESNEANNAGTLTVTVQGNKVKNQSFEQSNEQGTGPANWSGSDTGAGTTSWSDGGSEGTKSASMNGNGGNAVVWGSPTWTSDPIEVTAGETLALVTSVQATGTSSAATAGLVYLGELGEVLSTVTLLTAPLATEGFEVLESTVTIPVGVAEVRVILTGFAPTDTSTAGTVTFDDIGLFAT
jgi:hypothetical protein